MLISAAPVAIPVTTANPPTEAVASETALKVQVTKPAPSDNPNTRNTTENREQTKNQLDFDSVLKKDSSQEKSDENQESAEESTEGSKQLQEGQAKARKERTQELQEEKVVDQLKLRDKEVRAHELAHASAGGALAGAPQLDFTTGPDGKRYAVSGEVSIDTSKITGNSQATIDKMRQVRSAALAPANPSSQDLKVAAIASQVANQAQVELNVERSEEAQITKEETKPSKHGEIHFANPVTAKRTSLQLNQKIVNSGALDDYQEKNNLSQIV